MKIVFISKVDFQDSIIFLKMMFLFMSVNFQMSNTYLPA